MPIKTEELLKSISHVQSMYINDKKSEEIFDALLFSLLKVTESEYGFIGEIRYNEEKVPYLKTFAITDISWNEETRNFYMENAPRGLEFFNLKTLFGEVILNKTLMIANDPKNHPKAAGIPEGHPPLNAFLGVPLFYGGEMIGMFGIANKPDGYSKKLVQSLEPLTNTIVQLINAHQKNLARIDNENELNRQKNRLEKVIEGTRLGFWDWNPQTTEVAFNERLADMQCQSRIKNSCN